jgi:Arc/MetJ-type ribon-helix-helix transcriptional regulator
VSEEKRGRMSRNNMTVIALKIPEALLDGLDRLVEAGLYRSRSEAIRAAVRDVIRRDLGEDFFRIVNRNRRVDVEGSGGGA